jgi:hypothetical protein
MECIVRRDAYNHVAQQNGFWQESEAALRRWRWFATLIPPPTPRRADPGERPDDPVGQQDDNAKYQQDGQQDCCDGRPKHRHGRRDEAIVIASTKALDIANLGERGSFFPSPTEAGSVINVQANVRHLYRF